MNMSFGEGILCSILGMLVVFFGLVCLQVVIKLVGVIAKPGKAAADSAPAAVPAAAPAAAAAAPGTAGEIKLYGTSPRDAAKIMAITAEKTGKPLNELRFKSIREVK